MRKIKLDFTIPDAKSRQRFVTQYLKENESEFNAHPLTPKELEFISNYILFGKDEDGKNGVQKKMYEIQTRNKAWQRKQDTSLDTIMEDQPHHLSKLTQSAPHFSKRQVFDREEALARATTKDQKETYTALWARIDELEWQIATRELSDGKRTKPIRDELTERISPEKLPTLKEKALAWTSQTYHKKKYLLVELRQEQYTFRDMFEGRQAYPVQCDTVSAPIPPMEIGVDVDVRPLGLSTDNPMAFQDYPTLGAHNWTLRDKNLLSELARAHKTEDETPGTPFFDFTNEDHLRVLIETYGELRQPQETDDTRDVGTNWPSLADTLDFYISQANLKGAQLAVLRGRMSGQKNQDIADYVNKEFGKSYSSNYVSTVFCKGVLPKIAAAARIHLLTIEGIAERGNAFFKVCTCCGRALPMTTDFFPKKKNSLGSRCRVCEREKRKR